MRLLKLKTIRAQKLDRTRSWFWGEIAAGRFPKPVVDDLWSEPEVDAAIAAYIERLRSAPARSAIVRTKARATRAAPKDAGSQARSASNEPRALE